MADEKDIEEIKKLPPEERIKKLKELEEKRKKEIEKAKELVKESIDEIAKKEEENFIKERVIEEEEERAEKAAKKGIPLEEALAVEKPNLTEEQSRAHRDYILHLSRETKTKDLYSMAKDLAQEVQETGYLNQQQQHLLSDIERAQQYKSNDVHNGKYKVAGEEITDLLSATKNLLDDLKGKYKR